MGYIYITNSNAKEGLEEASSFLKKLDILQYNLFDIDECDFWLNNLENRQCIYSEGSKNKYFENVLKLHSFNHKNLMYQAFQHPTILTPESIFKNYNYVTSSNQRLSFLGEALVSLIVSKWVYTKNPGIDVNESMLHKLKICGINHHIISLMSIDMKFDTAIICWNRDMKKDLELYKEKIMKMRQNWENPKKIKKEDYSDLDLEFTIILCEVFYSFWGAVLLDTKNVPLTIDKFLKECVDYLLNNATIDNFTEHPKVEILELFFGRRYIFKEIKEKYFNNNLVDLIVSSSRKTPSKRKKTIVYSIIK